MNTTIQNFRILPEVDSMKNVIYTVEVKIDKEVEGKSKSIFRTYTLETPSETSFINLESLPPSTIQDWVNVKVQEDESVLTEYFNGSSLTQEQQLSKKKEALQTFIEKQKRMEVSC